MILKIGDTRFEHYNNVNLALSLDSIASSFSFDIYFDPTNQNHRRIFRPDQYLPCIIEEDGELLLTGTVLMYQFKSSAVRSTVQVSGYSKTGIMEDCEVPVKNYPLHYKKLTLREIATKIAGAYNIGMVIDPAITSKVDQPYKSSMANDNQNAKSYLCDLAGQKQVIVTHDEKGDLVLTEAKTKVQPVFDFTKGMPGVEMNFFFDGQRMHGNITAMRQASKGTSVAGQSTVINPYCKPGRSKIIRQTCGENSDTGNAARNVLSDELKGVGLKINIDRWKINGKIIRPNSIITVQNDDLFIFKKTKFLIESVSYKGDQNANTAELTCYLPEVYNTDTPKNIFD